MKTCHCKHDKATHHEGKWNCLAFRCDCEVYQDSEKPFRQGMKAAKALPLPDDRDTLPGLPVALPYHS